MTKVILDARHLADGVAQAQAGDITAACVPLVSRSTGLTAEALFAMSLSCNSVFDESSASSMYNSGRRIEDYTSEWTTSFHKILAARRLILSDPHFSLNTDIVNYY